jgi:hypothetical protein
MTEGNGTTPKMEQFIVELVINDRLSKHAVECLNIDSLRQLMAIYVSQRMSKVGGYNLRAADGTLIDSVQAANFATQIDGQVFNAGVQVFNAGSGDFKKLLDEAKKEGRIK